jgi:hypothetical protein
MSSSLGQALEHPRHHASSFYESLAHGRARCLSHYQDARHEARHIPRIFHPIRPRESFECLIEGAARIFSS